MVTAGFNDNYDDNDNHFRIVSVNLGVEIVIHSINQTSRGNICNHEEEDFVTSSCSHKLGRVGVYEF